MLTFHNFEGGIGNPGLLGVFDDAEGFEEDAARFLLEVFNVVGVVHVGNETVRVVEAFTATNTPVVAVIRFDRGGGNRVLMPLRVVRFTTHLFAIKQLLHIRVLVNFPHVF